MIIKEWSGQLTNDIRLKAGQDAEKQMAFYLKREFGKDKNIFVFNNIRIIHEGEVAQIDHLILHPYGFSLIESKSISGSVEINKHGEWIRWHNNKPTGMRSPLIQLEMQKDILISFLDTNAEKILGKVFGLIQQGVGRRSYDCVTAISDQAVIVRNKKVKGVYKADVVASILRKIIKQHKRELLTLDSVWFNKKELESISSFLLESDQSKGKPSKQLEKKPVPKVATAIKNKTQNTIKKTQPAHQTYWQCKCGGIYDIRYANTTYYGKSFYRYCADCKGRTPLKAECPQCHNAAQLKLTERLITYTCSDNLKHHGIFYKNKKLWLKDKNKLASETT